MVKPLAPTREGLFIFAAGLSIVSPLTLSTTFRERSHIDDILTKDQSQYSRKPLISQRFGPLR